MTPEWASVLLVGGGIIGQAAFWVFSQGQLKKDVAELRERFDQASERSSEKMSDIQVKINKLELKQMQIEEHLIFTDRRIDELLGSGGPNMPPGGRRRFQ